MTAAANSSVRTGPVLVVDNAGFVPPFVGGRLRKERQFRARFTVLRNQLPAIYTPAPAAPHTVADAAGDGQPIGFKTDRKPKDMIAASAQQFADWLNEEYTAYCARHPAKLEAVTFVDRLPSDEVIHEAVCILRARGFAVGCVYRIGGATFSIVRRWS